MDRYAIVVHGHSGNENLVFKSEIDLMSDDTARTYAAKIMVDRMRDAFAGDWWVDSIYNQSKGKYVLLRDE